MSNDGTGHIADCGYTEDSIYIHCGCYSLPGRLEAIVARECAAAKAEALREAAHELGGEWHAVAFNKAKDNLPPWGRYAKWLRDRADQVDTT